MSNEKPKSPREMAEEYTIKNVKYGDQEGRVTDALGYLREGDTAETCDGCVDDIKAVYIAHLAGLEAGAKMGWDAAKDRLSLIEDDPQKIVYGQPFPDWWAEVNKEGEK